VGGQRAIFTPTLSARLVPDKPGHASGDVVLKQVALVRFKKESLDALL